jgi:hypothetical protein
MAWLCWLWCAVGIGIGVADDEPGDDADDIPVVGRPVDLPFSGASGRFTVELAAASTTIPTHGSAELTLQVTAVAPVRHPPRRIDLRRLPQVVQRFHVEEARPGDDRRPAADRWEFVYRLKPKSAGVVEAPSIPFVYFDPAIQPSTRAFVTLYTRPIALKIETPPPYPVTLEAPERFFALASGPGLLAAQQPWRLPSAPLLALLLAGVPMTGVACYLVWKRLNPDAARRARLRRSRAARLALSRLGRARGLPDQGPSVAETLAAYLHERFDLAAAEPTPAETRAHLSRAGCPLAAVEVERLLHSCDAARFAPAASVNGRDLVDDAERAILAMETEACGSSPHSSEP